MMDVPPDTLKKTFVIEDDERAVLDEIKCGTEKVIYMDRNS